jgi:TPR repeat protein
VCDAGDAPACERAADERARAHDYSAANAYYSAACQAGRAASCNHLAYAFNTGLGTTQSHKKAFELFARSCDLDDASGCASLAILLAGMGGAGADTPSDRPRALSLAQRWCDRSGALACDAYGRMLWESHDPSAVQMWEKACADGPQDREGYQGCVHLAQALLDGQGIPVDVQRALDVASRACDAAMPAACNLVGWTYWNGKNLPRDAAKAVPYFRRACDAGDDYGCANLGSRYLHGEGVDVDVEKARKLFRWSCDRGLKVACDNLQTMQQGEP